MYYRLCEELTGTAAEMLERFCVCSHQAVALFCRCHQENVTNVKSKIERRHCQSMLTTIYT